MRTLRICGEQQAAAAVLSAPVLDALSAAICQCSSLQQLEVHGLGVPMLPAGMSQLQQLQSVSIASTNMARRVLQSPDAALAPLGGCSRLQSLTLAGCELRSLPVWLLNLTQLTALQLSGNYIQELQNAACCFGLPAGLQLLNLSDNRLRGVPGSIAGLQQLSVLQLDANYLSSLPRHIWALPALQELSVRENMLAKLPDFCGSSSRSTATSSSTAGSTCSGPQQQQQQQQQQLLPPAVAAPVAAADDDVDENDLSGMGVLLACTPAASNGPSNWDTSRRASSNTDGSSRRNSSSTASPSSSSLRSLVLAENQLAQLPASITALSCLQHLDLGHNQLQGLPETGSLWGLTRLTSLHLGHNHLKKIPAGITRLQQLVSLDVSGNHLPGLGSDSSSSMAQAVLNRAPAVAAPSAAAASAPGSFSAATAVCAAAVGSSAAAAAAAASPYVAAPASAATAAGSSPRGSPTGKQASRRISSSGSSSFRDSLPSPLRHLKQLKQLRTGGQQVDNRRSSSCPLAMLLGGLADLVELLRSLAPPGHQCPVTKAAAAAVAHLTRVSGGKRARRERERQLLERVQSEPGWMVLPAPKAASGLAAGAPAVAGGGAAMAVY
jgi:Leucine-rich repeat (LRR) protein